MAKARSSLLDRAVDAMAPDVIVQLKRAFAIYQDVQGQIPEINSLIDSVKKFLDRVNELIVQPTADKNGSQARQNRALENFFEKATPFLESLKAYNRDIAKQKLGVGSIFDAAKIVGQFNQVFEQLPEVISAFNDIGLGDIFREVTHELKYASTYLEKNIPDKLQEAFSGVSDYLLKPANFKDMSQAEQALRLQALSEANTALQKVVLLADEIEIKFARGEGTIVKLDFVRFGKEKKSIHDWCEIFTKAYQDQLMAAGYKEAMDKIDFYPYPVSKIVNREKIKAKFERAINLSEVSHASRWQALRHNMLDYLRDELKEKDGEADVCYGLNYLILNIESIEDKGNEVDLALRKFKLTQKRDEIISPETHKMISDGLSTDYVRDALTKLTAIEFGLAAKSTSFPEGSVQEHLDMIKKSSMVLRSHLESYLTQVNAMEDSDEKTSILMALAYLKKQIEDEGDSRVLGRNIGNASNILGILKLPYFTGTIKPHLDKLIERTLRDCEDLNARNQAKLKLVTDRIQGTMVANQYTPEQLAEKKGALATVHTNNRALTDAAYDALVCKYERFKKLIEAKTIDDATPGMAAGTAIDKASKFLKDKKAKLETMLDQAIFKQYFVDHGKDIVKSEGVAGSSLWIKEIGDSYLSAQRALAQLTQLQQDLTKRTNGALRQDTPDEFLRKELECGNKLLEHFEVFITAAKNLSHNPFLKQSTTEFAEFQDIIAIKDKVIHHPSVQALQENAPKLFSHAISKDRVSLLIGDLDDFLKSTSKERGLDSQTRDHVRDTLKYARKINDAALGSFDDSPASTLDVVGFCLSNWRSILKTLSGVGQVAASLNVIANQELMKLLQDTNLLLRDLYLYADKLEMKYYLQEGYLSKTITIGKSGKSLEEWVRDFHLLLESKGYEFLPEERFPYSVALLEQRKRLKGMPHFDPAFVQRRIDEYQPVPMPKPVRMKPAAATIESEKKLIIRDLDLKIDALKNKRQPSFFGSIVNFFASIFTAIGNFFAKLFGFSTKNESQSEDVILGLTALRDEYKKPGYTMGQALTCVKGQHARYYKAMMNEEASFVESLKLSDRVLVESQRHNKVLDLQTPKPAPVPFKAVWCDKLVSTRIAELDKEQQGMLASDIKQIKIDLLSKLKIYLSGHPLRDGDDHFVVTSFDDAVARLSKKYPDTCHHLFKGRTGEMMRQLRLSTMTNEQMIERIDLEIARLKKQQQSSSTFFAASRDKSLQVRINAMERLKRCDQFDVNALTIDQRKVLLSNDGELLRDIEKWRAFKAAEAVPAKAPTMRR